MVNETVLQQLPGRVPNERILVCLKQFEAGWSIGLRQQHWAEGIGWYDQKVLQLDARQWAALRSVCFGQLGQLPPTVGAPATIPFPGPVNPPTTPGTRTAEQA